MPVRPTHGVHGDGADRVPRNLPAARYTSEAWEALERDRLWACVWQIACTEDCVPEPGDWWEYEVAGISVIVVRGDDGVVRAFQNTCRHRGNALLSGQGTGLSEIRCAYHHWCYDLRGNLRQVDPDGTQGEVRKPGARPATSSPLSLLPVRADTWAGFVFVSLDPEGESLSAFLGDVPKALEWVGMERFTCDRFMTVPLACNWKVVVDAFIETYHLHAVHPQMLAIADDVHTPIELMGRHSMFMQPYGVPSPRREGGVDDQELWEAYVQNLGHRLGLPFAATQSPGPHPPVPEGQTMRDVLLGRIRAHLSSQTDAYDGLEDTRIIDDFHYHVFPNAVFNVFAGWYGLVRARPGPTPHECFLDMWNFDLPAADAPRPRPESVTLASEDLPALGPVLMQDLELLPRVQQGLRQPGADRIQLMPAEARIGRMHEVLEEYLDPPLAFRLER